MNGSFAALELSEASVESAGAKAAACRTLSVLASLSNKGIKFSFNFFLSKFFCKWNFTRFARYRGTLSLNKYLNKLQLLSMGKSKVLNRKY